MAIHRKIVIKHEGTLESFAAKLDGANTVKYTPGTIVKLNASGNFAKAAATDANDRLFVLNTRDYVGDLTSEEQSGGDTGNAFELIPNRTVQLRKTAAALALNAKVKVTAAGQVVVAGDTDTTVGSVVEVPAATADALVKVRIF